MQIFIMYSKSWCYKNFWIPYILENNVYFMSHVKSKFLNGNPKYIFCTQDSLKLAGDFLILALTILKLNT